MRVIHWLPRLARAAACGLLFLVPSPSTLAAGREGQVALWGGYVLPPWAIRNIVKIAAGDNYNLALDRDGKVHFWQFNDGYNGNLPAALDSGVVDVGCMGGYPYALKSDHTIVSWGVAPGGWNTPPAGLNNVASFAPGALSYLVVTTEARPLMWGVQPWFLPPAGLENVKALASSGTFSLALKNDGTLGIWGWMNGVTPVLPAGLEDVIAIAASGWNDVAYALRRDGSVVAWTPVNGKTSEAEGGPPLPAGLTNVTAIAAGLGHGMALKADGTVVSWGGYVSDMVWYNSGQYVPMAEPPAGLTGVSAIAAGHRHCLALKQDGTVVQWGSLSAGGDFAPGDKAVEVQAGWRAVTVLKADGTVTTWGTHSAPAPAGLTDVVDIDMGQNAVLAIQRDGTVASWANGNDQVPAGLQEVRVVVTGVDNGFGIFNNLALKHDASVAAWGSWGQPTPNGFQGAQAVAADGTGNQYANGLVLDTNGVVHAWGVSWLTPPPGLSNVVAVACGSLHGLALKVDGTVASWGSPDIRHQPPAGLADVIKIAASGNDSMAIRSDGGVVTWGGIAWGTPPPAPPAGLGGAFDGTVGSGLYGVIYSLPEPAQLTRHCPQIGEAGTEITLQGSSLTWVTNVLFNGVPVQAFTKVSDFLIRAKVPPGATTGPILVQSAYGNATGAQEFVVPNGLTPIESWRRLYFGAPEPVGEAADDADPDGDRMVNLLEYYSGAQPRQADVRPSLIGRALVLEGGELWFEFLERHYVQAKDVSAHYEWTTGGSVAFQPYTGPVKAAGIQPGENCETEYLARRIQVPAAEASLYVRYRLTRP